MADSSYKKKMFSCKTFSPPLIWALFGDFDKQGAVGVGDCSLCHLNVTSFWINRDVWNDFGQSPFRAMLAEEQDVCSSHSVDLSNTFRVWVQYTFLYLKSIYVISYCNILHNNVSLYYFNYKVKWYYFLSLCLVYA